MGDVIGLDDVPVFLPKQANSSQYIATVIGDNLHRHANTFADRAEVSRDDCAVAASQHSAGGLRSGAWTSADGSTDGL